MLARRMTQSIRYQRQRSIRQLSTVPASTRQRIQLRLHSQFLPEMPRHKHRSPVPCSKRVGFLSLG